MFVIIKDTNSSNPSGLNPFRDVVLWTCLYRYRRDNHDRFLTFVVYTVSYLIVL